MAEEENKESYAEGIAAKEPAKKGILQRTYLEILEMGEAAVEKIQLPFKVREAKNKLSGELIRIEGEIAQGELKISAAKAKHPLDLTVILNAIDDRALKVRQLEQANELMEELFPKD